MTNSHQSYLVALSLLLFPAMGMAQNVGIGTNAPSEKLHVYQATGNTIVAVQSLPTSNLSAFEARNASGTSDLTRFGSNMGSTIAVIQLIGISDRTLLDDLNRYLQGLNLSIPMNGKISFEMIVDQGNVQRAIFDDLDFNLDLDDNQKEAIIIDQIRRSLLTWQPPTSVSGKIRITLELKATKS